MEAQMPKAKLKDPEADNQVADHLDNLKEFLLHKAKARLSEIVDEVRTTGKAVVIKRRKKPAAVIIGVDEYEDFVEIKDTIRTEKLKRALKGKRYDLEKVIAELDLGGV